MSLSRIVLKVLMVIVFGAAFLLFGLVLLVNSASEFVRSAYQAKTEAVEAANGGEVENVPAIRFSGMDRLSIFAAKTLTKVLSDEMVDQIAPHAKDVSMADMPIDAVVAKVAPQSRKVKGSYNWLLPHPKDQPVPPINMLVDFRNSRMIGHTLSNVSRGLVTTNMVSKCTISREFIELSAAKFRNVNVFMIPGESMGEYSQPELRLLDDFMHSGGVVIAGGGSELSMDFLKSNGLEFEDCYLENVKREDLVIYPRNYANIKFEMIKERRQLPLATAADWQPILTFATQGKEFLAIGSKSIGKGRLVYYSDVVLFGWSAISHDSSINARFWGGLMDSIAWSCRRVDEQPLEETRIADCKVCNAGGVSIYASEKYRKDAIQYGKELELYLTALQETIGVAFRRPLDRHHWLSGSKEYSLCAGDRVLQEGVSYTTLPALAESQLENVFRACFNHAISHFSVYFIGKEGEYNFRYLWDGEIGRGLMGYLVLQAFEKMGRNQFAQIRGSWSRHQKCERLMEVFDKLQAIDERVFLGFFRQYHSHVKSKDFKRNVDFNQAACIFAETLYKLDKGKGRYKGNPNLAQQEVFSIFTACGIDVEQKDIHMERAGLPKEPWAWEVPDSNIPEARVLTMSGRSLAVKMVGCKFGKRSRSWPDHRDVFVPEPYWISETQITKGQYDAVMTPAKWKKMTDVELALGGMESAADGISLTEAMTFCKILNAANAGVLPDGYEIRLPTEIEWEFARQGRQKNGGGHKDRNVSRESARPYAYLPEDAEHALSRARIQVPKGSVLPMGQVKTKSPNGFGIYDMVGNGWEYVPDRFEFLPAGLDPSKPADALMTMKYEPLETNRVHGAGIKSGYGLRRGGGFLVGEGFGRQLFPLDEKPIPKNATFRIVIGRKLSLLPKEGE